MKKTCKRVLMMFMAVYIAFFSLYCDTRRVYGAEIVIGIGATVKGLLTALTVSGVLKGVAVAGGVALGGIALDQLMSADDEDINNFKTGLKSSFTSFVQEYEKNQIIQDNAGITEQQALQQALQNAQGYADNLFKEGINQTRTTGKNLQVKAVDYWQEFADTIEDCAINSDSSSGGGSSTNLPVAGDIVPVPVYNVSSVNVNIQPQTTNISKFRYLNNKAYITKGIFWHGRSGSERVADFTTDGDSSHEIFIPYISVNSSGLDGAFWSNQKQVNFELNYMRYSYEGNYIADVHYNTISLYWDEIIPYFTFPMFIHDNQSVDHDVFINAIAVGGAGGNEPQYKTDLKNIIKTTSFGLALKQGLQALQNTSGVNSFGGKVNYLVKKNSINVYDVPDVSGSGENERGYTGQVGWDIPNEGVYGFPLTGVPDQDVPSYPDVVGGTGVLNVPKTGAREGEKDTTVDIDADTTVSDPADDDDDPDPDPDPDPSIEDWVNNNAGKFLPFAMDLTTLFPFCIPFDIIYLVEKFDVSGENAPVITIPIVYPNVLQGSLGTSYDVVIDFSDFVGVRNVLRVFLLLLFIIGLMQITRNLIRG